MTSHATWLRNRPGGRIEELLNYNNAQVEKRREATTLLREASALFRSYEAGHRAKAQDRTASPAEIGDRIIKARRNGDMADRIDAFLKDIHNAKK